MKEVVIFDTEYTAWEGSQERNWSEPWEYRELVQISAQRIDPQTLEATTAPLDLIIRPRINPDLSAYFTKLTTITNEVVRERGIDFVEAVDEFTTYIKNARLCSFGDDCSILNENTVLYNLQGEPPTFKGADIRQWSIEQGLKIPNSGAFSRSVGAPVYIREHNALEDVRSIHMAIKFLVEAKGFENPFLSDTL